MRYLSSENTARKLSVKATSAVSPRTRFDLTLHCKVICHMFSGDGSHTEDTP